VAEVAKREGRGAGGMSRRTAAWFAWSLVALSVVLVLGGDYLSVATRSVVRGSPYDSEAFLASALYNLATLLPFSVVGAFVASRQPRNVIGWIFCSIGLVVGLDTLAKGYAEFWLESGSGTRSLAETAAWFSSWAWIPLVLVPTSLLLLLFPDGTPPSPRWRPVVWCAGLGITGFAAGTALEVGPLEDMPQITNPYGVDSPVIGIVGVTGAIVAGSSMVASAVSLVIRMRFTGSASRSSGSLMVVLWWSAPSA
jgi:hypothetical protein